MMEKLKNIFKFLTENRRYNREIQSSFFKSVLENKKSKEEKLISLLYCIAETQSRPSIKNLASSYRLFHNYENNPKIEYKTFDVFCSSIKCDKTYKHLFNIVKSYNGYGDKTSASY